MKQIFNVLLIAAIAYFLLTLNDCNKAMRETSNQLRAAQLLESVGR